MVRVTYEVINVPLLRIYVFTLPGQQSVLHFLYSTVPFSQSITQLLFLNFVPLPHVTEQLLQFDHGPA